jgi:hypothetical protein
VDKPRKDILASIRVVNGAWPEIGLVPDLKVCFLPPRTSEIFSHIAHFLAYSSKIQAITVQGVHPNPTFYETCVHRFHYEIRKKHTTRSAEARVWFQKKPALENIFSLLKEPFSSHERYGLTKRVTSATYWQGGSGIVLAILLGNVCGGLLRTESSARLETNLMWCCHEGSPHRHDGFF